MSTEYRRLAVRFWRVLGCPVLYKDAQTAKSWEKIAYRLLRQHTLDQATEVLEHALLTDSFWTQRIHGTNKDPFEFFSEHYETIAKQLEGFKKGLESDRRKTEKQVTARKSAAANADKPEYRKKPGDQIVRKEDVIKL
jgi:uncharacterized damage-inducible protein DinB